MTDFKTELTQAARAVGLPVHSDPDTPHLRLTLPADGRVTVLVTHQGDDTVHLDMASEYVVPGHAEAAWTLLRYSGMYPRGAWTCSEIGGSVLLVATCKIARTHLTPQLLHDAAYELLHMLCHLHDEAASLGLRRWTDTPGRVHAVA